MEREEQSVVPIQQNRSVSWMERKIDDHTHEPGPTSQCRSSLGQKCRTPTMLSVEASRG